MIQKSYLVVLFVILIVIGFGCVGGNGTQYLALPYAHMTINFKPENELDADGKEKMLAVMSKGLKVNPEPTKQLFCPICQADEFSSPSCPVCDSIRRLPVYARYQCPVCSGEYQGTNAVRFIYVNGQTNVEKQNESEEGNLVALPAIEDDGGEPAINDIAN
jgi:hypothetical protein